MDIIDEEILIQWGEHPSKKYVSKDLSKTIHAKAAPVINWLKEAEEESSEEEEEEVGDVCFIVFVKYSSLSLTSIRDNYSCVCNYS